MKKFALATLMTVLSLILHSQAPPNFRYQTVLRNNTGEILADKSVGLKISILKDNPSGQVVYSETFSSLTNALGLINLSIGSGDAIFGSISSIDWKEGPFFMRIDVDQDGGSNFEFLGTSQLLSVPYALYAEKSGNVAIVDSELYWKRNVNNLYYNTGNIGIGTFNPVSLLNIAGSVQSGTGRNLLQIQNNTNDNLSYTGILLKTGLSGGQSVVQDYGINYSASPNYDFAGFLNLSNNSRGVMIHANSADGLIKFYTGHDEIAGAGIERMRINAGGNVGIGTDSPKAKLEIADGDVYIKDIERGIIMTSPNGQCWRGILNNSGILEFTSIDCP